MDEGRRAVPWLNLLPDDHLDFSVVFAPFLDERLDDGVQVVGHFTAVNHGLSPLSCITR